MTKRLLIILVLLTVSSAVLAYLQKSPSRSPSLLVDYQITLGQTRTDVRRSVKNLNLTLWETTRWRDVVDTNVGDEYGNSLAIEYGWLGRCTSLSGSARILSLGNGVLQKGASETDIIKIFGPPMGTLKKEEHSFLIYKDRRLVLSVGPDGYGWFYWGYTPYNLSNL